MGREFNATPQPLSLVARHCLFESLPLSFYVHLHCTGGCIQQSRLLPLCRRRLASLNLVAVQGMIASKQGQEGRNQSSPGAPMLLGGHFVAAVLFFFFNNQHEHCSVRSCTVTSLSPCQSASPASRATFAWPVGWIFGSVSWRICRASGRRTSRTRRMVPGWGGLLVLTVPGTLTRHRQPTVSNLAPREQTPGPGSNLPALTRLRTVRLLGVGRR